MITTVTEKETQLSNMLHTCSEALKQVTAERDKLAGELKALLDSGVEFPEPFFGAGRYLSIAGNRDAYTESQLRDYGDRRAMAERERCAKVCEKIDEDSYPTTRKWPSDCAESIRKGEKS